MTQKTRLKMRKSKDEQSYLRPGMGSFDIYNWDNLHQITVIITRILRTVWLKKCLTMFKKTEGMAEWGLDYNSTSRLLWEMSTKLWENLPKFIWQTTNIWVSFGTKPGPGGFPCQYTPALRFPSNPAKSKGRLGCLTDRQGRGGPMDLPHLKTQ